MREIIDLIMTKKGKNTLLWWPCL